MARKQVYLPSNLCTHKNDQREHPLVRVRHSNRYSPVDSLKEVARYKPYAQLVEPNRQTANATHFCAGYARSALFAAGHACRRS